MRYEITQAHYDALDESVSLLREMVKLHTVSEGRVREVLINLLTITPVRMEKPNVGPIEALYGEY